MAIKKQIFIATVCLFAVFALQAQVENYNQKINEFLKEKNYTKAIENYQKAARLGSKMAQEKLQKLGQTW